METDEGADVNILLGYLSSGQRVGRDIIYLPITPAAEFYSPQPATGGAGDRIPPLITAVGLQDEGDGPFDPIDPGDSERLNQAFGDQLPGIGVPQNFDQTAERLLKGIVDVSEA
ncbi:MAG: hypothetical protein ACD_37C00433G0003 [uncultured bacterium]|nr:MAG: hypothetical protein ACD_37C00433G0003 [uncultured bacterium]